MKRTKDETLLYLKVRALNPHIKAEDAWKAVLKWREHHCVEAALYTTLYTTKGE